MLPYLANLTAFHSADPNRLRELETLLSQQAPSCPIVRAHPNWIVQMRPLPHGPEFTATLAENGLFFVEGPEYFQSKLGEINAHPLLHALRQDDPDFLKFDADLGFLHIDTEGQATLVRSSAGRVPLYVWALAGVVAISSTLQQRIHCFPDHPADLDPLVCAMHASGVLVFPNGRTSLAGVQMLETGHFLRVRVDGVAHPRKYWPVPCATLTPTPAGEWLDRAAELRDLLSQNLDRELSETHNNLVSFSGGVDSSCVVSLGRRLAKPIVTYSLWPPGGSLNTPQNQRIERIRKEFNVTEHLTHELSIGVRAEFLMLSPPLPLFQFHPVLCYLPELVRRWQPVTLTGGEYADRLLGGRGQTLWDLCRDSSLGVLWRSTVVKDFVRLFAARTLGEVGPGRKFRGSPYALALKSWIRTEVKEEYGAWLQEGSAEAANDSFPRWHLRQRIRMNAAITMNWEACSRLNVRRTYPFLTRKLLDLALTTHPADHYGRSPRQGRSSAKLLLREALHALVPSANLYQTDKPLPNRVPKVQIPPNPWPGRLTGLDELAPIVSQELLGPLSSQAVGPFDALLILGLLNIVRSLRN